MHPHRCSFFSPPPPRHYFRVFLMWTNPWHYSPTPHDTICVHAGTLLPPSPLTLFVPPLSSWEYLFEKRHDFSNYCMGFSTFTAPNTFHGWKYKLRYFDEVKWFIQFEPTKDVQIRRFGPVKITLERWKIPKLNAILQAEPIPKIV